MQRSSVSGLGSISREANERNIGRSTPPRAVFSQFGGGGGGGGIGIGIGGGRTLGRRAAGAGGGGGGDVDGDVDDGRGPPINRGVGGMDRAFPRGARKLFRDPNDDDDNSLSSWFKASGRSVSKHLKKHS